MQGQEFRLGDFRVRPLTRELIGGAGTVRLKPRSMDVLVDLAAHAGQLRTRGEVLAAVWGDVAVGEEVLTHCIWELRQALGDDRREPRFIETLHRSGYRLIAPVTVLAGEAASEPLAPPPPSLAAPRPTFEGERELALLRGRVQRFWVEQVLERSLAEGEVLALEAEERSDLVRHPWAGEGPSLPVARAEPAARPRLPSGETLLATFERMGSALLIVGAVGAGKTMTLLQLAREALERSRRDPDAPVPVVLPVASWSERSLPLDRWASAEIRARYFLPRQLAASWLASGRLLLLLDGLDEVAPERRGDCIAAINRLRRSVPLTPLAVACREEDYAASAGAGKLLDLDGAIGLLPLAPAQVAAALAPRLGSRGADSLCQVATTPLLLGLARRSLAGEGSPAEETGGAGAREVRDRLLQRLVREALPAEGGRRGYGGREARRWLSRLARAMLERSRTVLSVEELQPSWLDRAGRRGVFVLTSRALLGLWIGAAAAGFLALLSGSSALGRAVLLDGLLGGLGVALLDGLLLRRAGSTASELEGCVVGSAAYAALAGSAAAGAVLSAHLASPQGSPIAAPCSMGCSSP